MLLFAVFGYLCLLFTGAYALKRDGAAAIKFTSLAFVASVAVLFVIATGYAIFIE